MKKLFTQPILWNREEEKTLSPLSLVKIQLEKIFNCHRIQDLFFVKIFDHYCCSPRQFQHRVKKTLFQWNSTFNE